MSFIEVDGAIIHVEEILFVKGETEFHLKDKNANSYYKIKCVDFYFKKSNRKLRAYIEYGKLLEKFKELLV